MGEAVYKLRIPAAFGVKTVADCQYLCFAPFGLVLRLLA